jgi:hypothetical protein
MTRIGSSRDNQDDSVKASESAHVNINRIDLSGVTLLTVLLLVGIIGACGVVMGLNLAKQAQMDRDYRDAQVQDKLLERRYMDIEAYAILNGWKIPGDDTHGPTGNFDRMKPKESK